MTSTLYIQQTTMFGKNRKKKYNDWLHSGIWEVDNILLIGFKNNNKIIFIIDKVIFGNLQLKQKF